MITFLLVIFMGQLNGNFFNSNDYLLGEKLFNISLISLFFLLIGLSDDLFNLSPWPRLGMQIIGGSIAYINGIQIRSLDFSTLPFFSLKIELSLTISILLTIIWLVGVTNAFNWIDGLDGLAAGTTVICSIGFALFSLKENYIFITSLFAALSGSCAGFLRFNKYPSKIIMGDGGSYFVGFILASYGTLVGSNFNKGIFLNEFSTNILLPIIILAVPLFDMARVIFMRTIKGLSPLYPDRSHLHHKILNKGLGHRNTVYFIYFMNIIFMGIGLLLFY